MKKLMILGCFVVLSVAALAMPLGTTSRAVIPSDIQQIISVDYRALHDSPTAMALKDQVLPESLKLFEKALKGVGIDSERDVDQLTFAAYRTGNKKDVKVVGMAQGSFSSKTVLKRMKLKKIVPTKYRQAEMYSMGNGMIMSFLDENTLLFGDDGAVKGALDARDGYTPTLDSNPTMSDMMASVDGSPVWSLLDQQGTQNMMRSALGDATKVADYDTVKKRLMGSRYTMDFSSGVNFNLDVITSDSITAATMSSLVKAGMLYKKMSATPVEKVAIDALTVDSDSSKLQLHFKTDDKQFQALMKSDLFAAVSK
ncbi:MAG TPA: hypothetical protein VFA40_09820 [Terriglobales bacterium]|jgi:hypothetical protein|nr:hypothetical protein [Terriglobales bacterium]